MISCVLSLTDDELFAVNTLAGLTVQGITWTGGDPDELELKFRAGKVSLKKKLAKWTAPAAPEGQPNQIDSDDPVTLPLTPPA